jgi:SNF2 family DNA or RNA helicase
LTEGTRHEASDRGDAAPHPDEWRYFNRAELIGGDFLRHQREGITWLRTKQRSLLCDGTGVGKTVQALGAIALSLAAAENTAETPCLIVVPASLGPQWRKEMTRFLSPEVPVRHMDDDPAKLGPKQAARIHRQPPPWIEVVSYDTLAHRLDSYVGRRYGLVVLDEVGKVRGGGKLSQAARLVTLTASRVIGMTATPVENNTAETFEILHVLNLASELFGTRAAFYERFVDLKEFDGEWKVAGSLNVAEFAEIVAPYVLRRTIRDIGAQTPARVGPHEVMVPLGPAQTAAYAEACALPRGLKRFRAQEQATDFVVLPDGSYESARVAEAVRWNEQPGTA